MSYTNYTDYLRLIESRFHNTSRHDSRFMTPVTQRQSKPDSNRHLDKVTSRNKISRSMDSEVSKAMTKQVTDRKDAASDRLERIKDNQLKARRKASGGQV